MVVVAASEGSAKGSFTAVFREADFLDFLALGADVDDDWSAWEVEEDP